ncbi:MAG TPA: tetratricopeptide repeat protein [Terriglobales bacterium]
MKMLLAMVCMLLFAAPAFSQSMDEWSELDAGIQAYKNARYNEAIKHFSNVVSLNDSSVLGHLYLATAEAQVYIPGGDSPNSDHYALSAINEYKKVLELNPKSADSAKGAAYLYLQMHKFDEAKQYYQEAINIDPNDAGNYYAIGVISWTESYKERMAMRSKEKLDPSEPFINSPNCEKLHRANEALIKEGMDMLVKSLQVNPEYDDAMAYMNLMYREKADIDCNDMAAYTADLETADHWVDVTMATKKARIAKPVIPRVTSPSPIPK